MIFHVYAAGCAPATCALFDYFRRAESEALPRHADDAVDILPQRFYGCRGRHLIFCRAALVP